MASVTIVGSGGLRVGGAATIHAAAKARVAATLYKDLVLRDAPVGYWRLGDDEGYAQAVLSDAPVGYWRLDDAGGSGTAADKSGNGKTGTVVGGVTFQQIGAIADANKAALLNGSTGYLSVDTSVLNCGPSTQSFTIEFWSNGMYAAGNEGMLIKHNGGGPFNVGGVGWELRSIGPVNRFQFMRHASGAVPTILNIRPMVAPGRYSHVVITYNAATGLGTAYVNGASIATQDWSSQSTATGTYTDTFPLLIGAGQDGKFSGYLDEVAIYSYALSATQVANHYACRARPIATEAAATVADSSGHGYIGTVVKGVALKQAGALSDGNRAGLFDGLSGYVTMGNVAALRPTAAVSMEVWVNAGALNYLGYIGGCGNTGVQGYMLDVEATGIFWRVGNGSATVYIGGTVIGSGVWKHIVGTYDGTTSRLYVNGVQVASSTAVSGAIGYPSVTDFLVGQIQDISSSRYWVGSCEDVAVYPSALSPTQIAEHYAARTAASGLLTTGTASKHAKSAITPAGGVRLGGAATKKAKVAVAPSGGARVSGSATKHVKVAVAPTGGARMSGSGSAIRKVRVTSTGGLRASGADGSTRHVRTTVTGGLRAGGTGSQHVRVHPDSVAALHIGGSGKASRGARVHPTGGVRVGGTASPMRKAKVTPTGGLRTSGAAGVRISVLPSDITQLRVGGTAPNRRGWRNYRTARVANEALTPARVTAETLTPARVVNERLESEP